MTQSISPTSKSSKKAKLVRDSFTIPKAEFSAIDTLKTRAIALGTSVKKSELLRAGLMVLQGLSDSGFKAALAAVPTLKTGRPAAADPASPTPTQQSSSQSKAPAKRPVKPAAPVAPRLATRPMRPATPKAPAKTAAAPAAAAKVGVGQTTAAKKIAPVRAVATTAASASTE